MHFTKGEIDRLGNNIRNEQSTVSEKLLFDLQNYRTSHEKTISEIFNTLCSLSNKIRKDSIVTFRIKRIESIIGKLDRYPKMRFSRMSDIGGCRCILKNDAQVYKLKAAIEKNFIVKSKVNDYIKNPQKNGYKSLHLFVSLPDDDKVIEVQLRNQIDHNWSTLVEITDLLFDARLKEYGENKELLRFHYLLSKIKTIDINDKAELANILKKYSYFDKLSEVFTRNYLEVRKQWLEIERKKENKFFLIVATKSDVPRIKSFANFSEAEEEYFNVYKNLRDANIVLTHLQSPNFNQINIAYSNYILTFHTFMDDSHRIIENLIIDTLKKRKILSFIKYFGLYNSILVNHIKNLMTEMLAAKQLSTDKFKEHKYRKRRKNKKPKIEKEWYHDINKQIVKNEERTNKLSKSLIRNMPHANIERFFIFHTLRIISNKYNRRLNKVLATTTNIRHLADSTKNEDIGNK